MPRTLRRVCSLHPGKPLLSRNPATGKFKLTVEWKKAADLSSYMDFSASLTEGSVDRRCHIKFEFSPP